MGRGDGKVPEKSLIWLESRGRGSNDQLELF